MADLNVAALKVAELKEELEKRGLETKGLKKDLAERLRASIAGGSDAAPPTDEAKAAAVPLVPHDSAVVSPTDDARTLSGDGDEAPTLSDTGRTASEQDEARVAAAPAVVLEPDELRHPAMDVDALAAAEPASLDGSVARAVAAAEEAASRPDAVDVDATPVAADAPAASGANGGDGVGAAMVDERQEMDIDDAVETAPAALDSEAARAVAEAEDAASRPSPPRAPSPVPAPTLALPPELGHLLHPPTPVLYISNLRRPYTLPALHAHVSALAPLAGRTFAHPFSHPSTPGLWVDGVKAHAYAVFGSAADALGAARALDSQAWPEDTGGPLAVQFVDPAQLGRLVEEEEEAWRTSRQRRRLCVERDADGAGYRFWTEPEGRGAPAPAAQPPRAPVAAVPVLGRGAPLGARAGGAGRELLAGPGGVPPDGARAGGAGAMGIRGRAPLGGPGKAGRSPPPHLRDGRDGRDGRDARNTRDGRDMRERERDRDRGWGGGLGPVRRTRARPELVWREGPGRRR